MKSTLILRDYQEEISNKAVELLKKYKIAYLALQVRTGKTLTSFVTAHKFGAKSVLFVTKKKAISDIVNQFSGSAIEMGIYVTNYEQLSNVHETFDLIIIDEAHSLSAFPVPSARAKELKRICFGKPIIYLSGTPNPESFSQLYHQFWVSSYSPFEAYPNFYKWATQFVNVKKMKINGQSFNNYDQADKKMVMDCCGHLFLTFTQEQAGFESLINEHIHHVEMLESTYTLANRLRIDKIVRNKEGQVEVFVRSFGKYDGKQNRCKIIFAEGTAVNIIAAQDNSADFDAKDGFNNNQNFSIRPKDKSKPFSAMVHAVDKYGKLSEPVFIDSE